MPQLACDRCTLGVMDQTNPHLHGTCTCLCHFKEDPRMSSIDGTRYVIDCESDDQVEAILGRFITMDEDVAIYRDFEGNTRSAPADCVHIVVPDENQQLEVQLRVLDKLGLEIVDAEPGSYAILRIHGYDIHVVPAPQDA